MNLWRTPIGLATLIILFTACTPKPVSPEKGTVTFLIGDAYTLRQDSSETPLKLLESVNDGQTIRTGSGASVAIQIGDGIIVRITKNSTVTFTSIMNNEKTGISLSSDGVLSRVNRLGKTGSYTVKTPTMVASVRGTVFSVSSESGKAKISVEKGAVAVAAEGTKEEKEVPAGRAVVVDIRAEEKITEQEITREDSLELQKLESIPVIQAPDEKTITEMETIREQIVEKEKAIETGQKQKEEKQEPEKNNGALTLKQIRSKYGRIDVVQLFDGRVIKGAIIQRGGTMKILTPGGTVSVQSSKVQNTRTE